MGENINKLTSNNKSNKEYKIFKISLSFRTDILDAGIDPLILISKLYDFGDIIEANTNVSKLPNILELDSHGFYLSWTIVIRTKATKKDLEYIFALIREGNSISIDEYDETYLSYSTETMMENRIGEVLVEKGLITEEEIKKALGVQKKLGEILIEKGLITEEEIKKALEVQKKLGEILIDEGKVMPNKLESIIEQQKQVRRFKEMNSVRIDNNKLNNLIDLVNELLVNHSKIIQITTNNEEIDITDIKAAAEEANVKAEELLEQLTILRNSTSSSYK